MARKKKFKTESVTVGIRVPIKKKEHYKTKFTKIVENDQAIQHRGILPKQHDN